MSDQNATPGATIAGEDSVRLTAESSRLQGLQFIECNNCRAKPGSPVLCAGCQHNRQAIEGQLAEIKELKRLVLTTAKVRDEYRDDYYRTHKAYLDFKYPSTRGRNDPMSELEIQQQIKAHAASIVELSTMYQTLRAVGEKP